MLVKFILNGGNTVSIHAQDRKGNATNNVGDAIRRFHEIIGKDVPFVLASDHQARLNLAQINKAVGARELALATHVAEDSEKAAGDPSEALVEASESEVELLLTPPEARDPAPIQREVERRKLVGPLPVMVEG